MPMERRSVSGDNASPWSQEAPRGGDQLSEQDLSELRKLQQLQKSQAQLLAEGTAGFKSWGSDKEAGQLDLNGPVPDNASLNRRRGGLPPRAPMYADRLKQEMEGVQAPLPTVPSMVDRLSDNTKDYVDPKDAQNLLPSSLLDSASLDLASYLEAFERQRQLEAAGISLPALNLVDSSAFDLATLQSALPINRQSFVDPGSLSVVPTSVPPSIPPDTNVLPLRRRTIHHQRSNSEPVFALPTYQPPTNTPAAGLRTVPVLAVLPDFSVLPADYVDGQGLSARGTTSFNGVMPQRSRDRTMSFDHASLYLGNQERGANRPGSRVDTQNESRRRRNKARRTMSVDMGGLQNKMNFPKPERKPNAKTSKSAPTKTEVKRLVKYQVWVGKPIRTPWFRDSPRDPAEGGEEGEEENRPMGKGDSHSDGAVSPVGSPIAPRPLPTPKMEAPPPVAGPREVTVPSAMSSGIPAGLPSPIPSGIPRPTTAPKGTGFFCPTMP